MFRRILVPLDGSRRAERAIPIAARLARAAGGVLVFVRVVVPPAVFGKYARQHSAALEQAAYEKRRAQAASYLASMMLLHSYDLAGIECELEVATGMPAATLCSLARHEHIDLIVLCSHGEAGPRRWLFGSVARESSRHSPVPVLVLREGGTTPPRPSVFHRPRLLVALDDSPASELALEPAARLIAALATPGQGALHLLRVVSPPALGNIWRGLGQSRALRQEHSRQQAEISLQRLVERLQTGPLADLKLTITCSVLEEHDAARAILTQADHIELAEQSDGCDLIALAAPKHSGLHCLLAEGTAERLLGASRLPLLLVPPQEAPARVQAQA